MLIVTGRKHEKRFLLWNRHKKSQKACRSRAERFITRKVMAMVVSEVLESLAMTLPRLNLLLASPNFPSIELRILSSDWACFFLDLLIIFGGLPKGTPLILIPLSWHQARFSCLRYMRSTWIDSGANPVNLLNSSTCVFKSTDSLKLSQLIRSKNT